ncbi:hypothetical protein BOO86_15885 [Mycobacterium sp. CBMA 234]|uniref:lipoprotein LpqH n=1 Tax=Mycolicibacterium sp. CBMA 234 TaxID=1918495 RepID=UPI001390FD55|nr:lipoprotein LpqH [Mycolicibacterium sp. CBMA 234]MUL65957.1 hypothetical protein [Mycolicibacterium sp. CBMA 234]
MTNHVSALAGIIVALGALTACSSSDESANAAPGALSPGTARITIDGRSATTTDLTCTNVSQLLLIKAGGGGGFDATVDRTSGLTAKSLTIHDYNGFSGSYEEGLQGNARISKASTMFTISGSAQGFTSAKPSERVMRDFTVDVVC